MHFCLLWYSSSPASKSIFLIWAIFVSTTVTHSFQMHRFKLFLKLIPLILDSSTSGSHDPGRWSLHVPFNDDRNDNDTDGDHVGFIRQKQEILYQLQHHSCKKKSAMHFSQPRREAIQQLCSWDFAIGNELCTNGSRTQWSE